MYQIRYWVKLTDLNSNEKESLLVFLVLIFKKILPCRIYHNARKRIA
jgi:hypothetical protein